MVLWTWHDQESKTSEPQRHCVTGSVLENDDWAGVGLVVKRALPFGGGIMPSLIDRVLIYGMMVPATP